MGFPDQTNLTGRRFARNPDALSRRKVCAKNLRGLTLRFPGIKAIRRDKNVDSIDTLQYARNLAEQRAKLPVDSDEARR